MQYTLVVSDMDGTLLRDDKTISERTLRAIRQYEAAGGRFTVASGRGPLAMKQYVQLLGVRTPMGLLNGALLYDPETDRDLLCQWLSPAAVEAVWPILKAYELNVIAYGPRRAAVRTMNETLEAHIRLDGVGVDVVPNLSPRTAGPLVKLLAIGAEERIDRAEVAITRAGVPVNLIRSQGMYYEVLPPGAGKGAALEGMLKYLQIPRERSLAVGDFLNDLDMITAAGLGVAMANAHPDVKRAAGRWTGSNEEDGVAQLLEALVEGRPVGIEPAA
jgi:Cof subfamily protein (haloacid dehalogenase superfamily)